MLNFYLTVAGGSPQQHITLPNMHQIKYNTTPYYKVPLQYYFVLKNTTPVLLCTTKYYFILKNITLYYEIV